MSPPPLQSGAQAPPVPVAVPLHVPGAVGALAGQAELTGRALAVGLGLGALLAVTNVYMGLKTSWWESGCILASVLGFGVLGPLGRRLGAPYSPLENNLTMTLASSMGAVPAAAGLLGALPALALLGQPVPGWGVAAWGLGLGTLGVLAAFLLRRRLIVEEALPFPTGAATAEIITALHTQGAGRSRRARALAGVTLASMAVTFLRDARGWLPSLWALPGQVGGLSAGSLTLGVACSPMLLGIGAMVGPRMGLSMLLGALVGWGALGPPLVHAGVVQGAGYEALAGWLLWPGVGLLVGSALVALGHQAQAFVRAARDVRALRGEGLGPLVAGLGAAACVLVLVLGASLFGLPPGHTLLVLLLVLPLCAVCARAAGLTDISPVGQMGQLTQVASGALLRAGAGPNVAAGSVVAGAVAHTGVSMWALKAGHLLGASPRRQLLVQLLGVVAGAAVAVPAYVLLVRAWPLGSEALPVPAALQFRAVAELAARGLEGLPPHAALAALVGGALGAVLALLEARWPQAPWVPSPMALGIGLLVPAAYAVTLCLGALAVAAARARWPQAAEQHAPALGAGAIAGESLMGVAVAALLALGLMRPG